MNGKKEWQPAWVSFPAKLDEEGLRALGKLASKTNIPKSRLIAQAIGLLVTIVSGKLIAILHELEYRAS